MVAEGDTLKCIFARSFDDSIFRNKLGQLCASYLGGIWTSVPYQQIRIVPQRGGFNNKIFTVELPSGMKPKFNEPQKAILRIYENLSEDYELPEGVISVILAERLHLGPRLLGIFPGGRFEEYIPSRPLTNDEYCKPCVAQEVGRILARVHSLDMPINKMYCLTQIVDDLMESLKGFSRWSTSYPMHTTLAKVAKELCPDVITIDLLAKELETCKECLVRISSPAVFSNNDLHEGNLLLRDGVEVTDEGFVGQKDVKDPIVLIDYEYSCYYYRGFDLCHYCVECCQHNEGKIWPYYEIKQNQWPNEAIQRLYVGAYIDEANKIWHDRGGKRIQCITDLPDDREVAIEHLLREIRQFAAFPHLFWAIWAFRYAEIKQGDFDHFEYAFDRLAMYYYWKPEMLKCLDQ
uniref:Choline/ethanolamine kinase n=1 Tax=Elaeophora elaphi TaxID=1147741 RepID=A0A0R3S197_9BILA